MNKGINDIHNLENTQHLMKILYLVMKKANVRVLSIDRKELSSTIFDEHFTQLLSFEDLVNDKIIFTIQELEQGKDE